MPVAMRGLVVSLSVVLAACSGGSTIDSGTTDATMDAVAPLTAAETTLVGTYRRDTVLDPMETYRMTITLGADRTATVVTEDVVACGTGVTFTRRQTWSATATQISVTAAPPCDVMRSATCTVPSTLMLCGNQAAATYSYTLTGPMLTITGDGTSSDEGTYTRQ